MGREVVVWCRAQGIPHRGASESPLLVAHGPACLLVPHWAARVRASRAARPVRGAFLVAPPDPGGPGFPAAAALFRAVPREALPFPALVVASTDDPYAGPAFARRCAAEWDAGFVVAGALGHINAASGLGDWPQGAALLKRSGRGRGSFCPAGGDMVGTSPFMTCRGR